MIWVAKGISTLGDWFNQVALGFIVLSMTHSSVVMGFVLLCRSFPVVIFGPLLSPLADKYSKRVIMYMCDLFRAMFALVFILAYQHHAMPLLYLGAFLLGISGILFNPAQQAAIPLIVNKEDLANAYALNSSMAGMISILGALLGGIVSSFVNPVICFLVNSLSYLLSALFIYRAKWKEGDEMGREKENYLDSLKAGFVEVKNNKIVRSVILIGISWGFAGGAYYILIPLLGDSAYRMGGLGIGLLYSVDGFGIVTGAWMVKKWIGNHLRWVNVAYGIAYLTQAIFLALLSQTSSILTGIIMLFFMRVSSGIIIPLDSFILQKNTKVILRARVFSLHDATYTGFMQLSYALFGFLYATFGIPHVGVFAGTISLLCGLSWLLSLKDFQHEDFVHHQHTL